MVLGMTLVYPVQCRVAIRRTRSTSSACPMFCDESTFSRDLVYYFRIMRRLLCFCKQRNKMLRSGNFPRNEKKKSSLISTLRKRIGQADACLPGEFRDNIWARIQLSPAGSSACISFTRLATQLQSCLSRAKALPKKAQENGRRHVRRWVDGWVEQTADCNPYRAGHGGIVFGRGPEPEHSRGGRFSPAGFATERARRSADRARAGVRPANSKATAQLLNQSPTI